MRASVSRLWVNSRVAKVHVYELAKELGMESKELLQTLNDMGEFVRSASSTIEAPVVRRVKERIAMRLRLPRSAPRPGAARPRSNPFKPSAGPETPTPQSEQVATTEVDGLPGMQGGWNAGAQKKPVDPDLLRRIGEVTSQFPEAAVHLDALQRLGSQFAYVERPLRSVRPVHVRFSGAIESAFGFTREVIFFYCHHRDLKTNSLQAIKDVLKANHANPHVTQDVVFISARDPRLRAKLDDWSSPDLLLVPLPVEIQDDPLVIIELLREYIYSRDLFYEATPVRGSRFFGRRVLLQELRDDIRTRRVAGIYGLRKAGKTSTLLELAVTAGKDVVPILVDLEVFPAPPDDPTDDILKHVTRRLRSALTEKGVSSSELDRLESPSIVHWKEAVQDLLVRIEPTGLQILLMLDEVEYLTSDKVDVAEGDLPRIAQMLGAFRSLVQESSNFTFLLSGLASAITESGRLYGRPNPLFSWAKTYYIKPFTKLEADELSTVTGGKMGIEFDPRALAALFDGSGGHAFLYRSLASAAVKQLPQAIYRRLVGVPEVQRAFVPWRSEVAGHVQEMLNHVKRYYKTEALLLEFLMDDPADFDDLARSEGQAVRHLVNLGLVNEDGHTYALNSLLELAR